jgi:hypothetical protein
VPHYVRTLHAKVLHEGTAVPRLLHDAQRAIRVGAACEATPVIQDQLIPLRQYRFRQEWREGVCDVSAVHQHDWLSGTSDLVLQCSSINLC